MQDKAEAINVLTKQTFFIHHHFSNVNSFAYNDFENLVVIACGSNGSNILFEVCSAIRIKLHD